MHLQVRRIHCNVNIVVWRRLIRVSRMYLRVRLTGRNVNITRRRLIDLLRMHLQVSLPRGVVY